MIIVSILAGMVVTALAALALKRWAVRRPGAMAPDGVKADEAATVAGTGAVPADEQGVTA